MTPRAKKLLHQVRDAIRVKHQACSTEKTYVYWAQRFVLCRNKRHPLELVRRNSASSLPAWQQMHMWRLRSLFEPPRTGESLRRRMHRVRAHCAGTARPRGREGHNGLHPYPQPGRFGGSQSVGLSDAGDSGFWV